MSHYPLAQDLKDRQHFNINGIPGICTQIGNVSEIIFGGKLADGHPGHGLVRLVNGFVVFMQLPEDRGGCILINDEFSTTKLSELDF